MIKIIAICLLIVGCNKEDFSQSEIECAEIGLKICESVHTSREQLLGCYMEYLIGVCELEVQ